VLDLSEQNLEQLTEATGGRLYKPNSFSDLHPLMLKSLKNCDTSWALLHPAHKARDGSFRRVRGGDDQALVQATTRVGYFAPQS